MTRYYAIPSLSGWNKKQKQALSRLTGDGLLERIMENAWDKERRDHMAQTPTEPFDPQPFNDGPITQAQVERITQNNLLRQVEALQHSVDELQEWRTRCSTPPGSCCHGGSGRPSCCP
jgi:hypothetical protein